MDRNATNAGNDVGAASTQPAQLPPHDRSQSQSSAEPRPDVRHSDSGFGPGEDAHFTPESALPPPTDVTRGAGLVPAHALNAGSYEGAHSRRDPFVAADAGVGPSNSSRYADAPMNPYASSSSLDMDEEPVQDTQLAEEQDLEADVRRVPRPQRRRRRRRSSSPLTKYVFC